MNDKLIPEIQLELSNYIQLLRSVNVHPITKLSYISYHEDIVEINNTINNLKTISPKRINNKLKKYQVILSGKGSNNHAIKIDKLISKIGV